MILALDLATRLTGFCAGDGSKAPTCSAFKMEQHGENIGAMLNELDQNFVALFRRFMPDLVLYEAPILPQGRKGDKGAVVGSLLIRRKLFALGSHLEFFCHRQGVQCAEAEVRTIKKELAGHTKASKDDMVTAATKCGITLPATVAAGREDAADAFGLWLLGLRHTNRELSARWDRVLWSSRGALL